jgi:hypothetical protein
MFSNILLELMVSRLELKRESVNQRQARIIELVSKGKSLSEIAGLLHVHVSTISRDFQDIRGNVQKTTDQYLIETAPLELTKCLVRLNAVSDEAWALVEQASDHKEKIAALSLAMKAAVQLVNVIANNARIVTEEDDLTTRKKEGKSNAKNNKEQQPEPAETVF